VNSVPVTFLLGVCCWWSRQPSAIQLPRGSGAGLGVRTGDRGPNLPRPV